MLKTKDTGNKRKLFYLILDGKYDETKFFLESLTNKEREDIINFDNRNILLAIRNNNLGMAKLLIENGADVNKENKSKETPITEAATLNKFHMVKLLIDAKADVNKQDKSALTLAARKGYFEIAKLLIENGADINKRNECGITPIMEAARHGHINIVDLLLTRGAYTKVGIQHTALECAAIGNHLEIIKLLILSGVGVDEEHKDGVTIAMKAASEGNLELMQLLLELGADISKVNKLGHTALSLAAKHNHFDIIMELFGRSGDDFNKFMKVICDNINITSNPIVNLGNIACVEQFTKLLLDNDATPKIKTYAKSIQSLADEIKKSQKPPTSTKPQSLQIAQPLQID
jgi:ankyrin repeat protein